MSDLPASDMPKRGAQRPRAANDPTHFAIDVELLRGCRRLSTRHRRRAATDAVRRTELQAAVVPPAVGSP
jgi:hypothetical protein